MDWGRRIFIRASNLLIKNFRSVYILIYLFIYFSFSDILNQSSKSESMTDLVSDLFFSVLHLRSPLEILFSNRLILLSYFGSYPKLKTLKENPNQHRVVDENGCGWLNFWLRSLILSKRKKIMEFLSIKFIVYFRLKKKFSNPEQ